MLILRNPLRYADAKVDAEVDANEQVLLVQAVEVTLDDDGGEQLENNKYEPTKLVVASDPATFRQSIHDGEGLLAGPLDVTAPPAAGIFGAPAEEDWALTEQQAAAGLPQNFLRAAAEGGKGGKWSSDAGLPLTFSTEPRAEGRYTWIPPPAAASSLRDPCC